jgi:hypothetical protein
LNIYMSETHFDTRQNRWCCVAKHLCFVLVWSCL